MENVTIQNTPIPKAASTHVNNDRLKSLRPGDSFRFSLSSFGASDESSLGLLPQNFSDDVNNSLSQLSSKRSSSSKPPTLPSLTEHPDGSHIEASVDEVGDEVFASPDHHNLKNASENSKDYSISDLTNIEFCDQQISARSSVSDVIENDSTKRNKSNQAKTFYTSALLSNILRRHTLDVSEFIPPPSSSQMPDLSKQSDTEKLKLDFSNTVSFSELVNDVEASSHSFQPASDNVLNFYSEFGDKSAKTMDDINGAFTNNIKELIEKDEADFESEHRFSIENPNIVSTNVVSDTCVRDADNWRTSLQDITRPSWVSDELGSRISIGKLFAARGASIESGFTDSGLGDLGKDLKSNSLTKTRESCASNDYGLSKLDPLNFMNNIYIDTALHDEVSAILENLSINDDTILMAERMLEGVSKKVRPPSSTSNANTSQRLTEHRKVSYATHLTPIPSVSEAMSPVPTEIASKMDKVWQTSGEKLLTPCLQRQNEDIQQMMRSQYNVESCNIRTAQYLLQETNPSLQMHCVDNSSQEALPSKVSNIDPQPGMMIHPIFVGNSNSSVNSSSQVPSLSQLKSSTKRISTESSIKMQNENIHWLEGCYKLLSITCDGCEWISNSHLQVFSIPQSWDLQPNSTQFLNVVFCPTQKGKWKAQIQFYFRVISSCSNSELIFVKDVKNCLKWESSAVVILEGIADTPNLSLLPKNEIDFGIVTEESLTVKCVQITSKTNVSFPIRLIIDESFSRGIGYYFPNESGNVAQSRNFINVCCKPEAELSIPIAFKAPKNATQLTGGYFQLHSAVFRVELDGIAPNPVLATAPMSATVGAVRLFAPIKNDIIRLNMSFATSYTFPLYNQGGVPLNLQLTTNHPQNFSVVPEKVVIMPGGKMDISVHYHPLDLQVILQSAIQIRICPGGSLFEIQVIGNSHNTQSLPMFPASQNNLHLHCDRRAVFWGAVSVGQEVFQKLSLRNTNATETLSLVLIMKMSGEDDDGTFSFIDSSIRTLLTLSPGQQSEVLLKFLPFSKKKYSASLVIKPQRHSTGFLLKYTVPLVGYGGVSLLRLFGLNQEPTSTQSDAKVLNGDKSLLKCENFSISSSKVRHGFQLFIRNDGDRSTYVTMIHSLDAKSYVALPSWIQANVQPSSFILPPASNTTVSWSLKTDTIEQQCQTCDCYLILISLEDVLWQRCMILQKKGLLTSVSRNPHFMEPFLFSPRFSLSEFADSEIDASNLPCQDELNRLFSSMKLVCIKIKFASDCPSPAAAFVTLAPEQTFTEATYLEGFTNKPSAMQAPSCNEDSLVPTVDTSLKVSSTTVDFPETPVDEISLFKLKVQNFGKHDCPIWFKSPEPPFIVKQSSAVVKSNYYLSVPIRFQPTTKGVFKSFLRINTMKENSAPSFCISLQGNSA